MSAERRGRGSHTHLLVDEGVNLLERLAVHVLRKGLELAGQHVAILHGGLGARMEAVFPHQLDVPVLVLDLRLLRVRDDLVLGDSCNRFERDAWSVRVNNQLCFKYNTNYKLEIFSKGYS